ncbi:MAG: DNA gyrase inhibitor YacG [Sneathiella sp.]|nr:DNA gyrase inhibitor YacG [Sneathiella sp.]
MNDKKTPKKACLQCGKPVVDEYRPFCSARCKQLDLGKWFNESYVVPGEETIPANDEEGE